MAKAVGGELGWKVINTGQLLKQEEEKKKETSEKIFNAKKSFSYGKFICMTVIVDDKIVTDLVVNAVQNIEKETSDSWIIQGFPRTK